MPHKKATQKELNSIRDHFGGLVSKGMGRLKGIFSPAKEEDPAPSAPAAAPEPPAELVAPPPPPPIPAESKKTYFNALRQGDAPVLAQALEQHPALIHEKDGGLTGMHIAAHRDKHACILLLHKYGADLNARDHKGWTPLCFAAAAGAHKAVWTLAECRADIHAEDNSGETALDKALQRFLNEITPPDFSSLTAIVSAGYDPAHKTSRGHSPYSMAKAIGREDVLNALMAANIQRRDNEDLKKGRAPSIRVMTPPTVKKRSKPAPGNTGPS